MKNSGIEWLGEVPGHWSVSFLKRFCLKITDGAHFSPKTEFEGRNYISVKDVDEFGNIDLINCKKISQADFDDLVRNGCQPAKKGCFAD
jgi:type I restriction enzyme S subunit